MGTASHPMAALVGKLIGNRYRIVKELGSGTLDWIYQASDQQQNEQFVTLKVLQPQFASQAHQRQRFLQEARQQESLWHPSVVQIQAIQEADDHVYIATEWIEGETLGEMAKRFGSPFSIDAVVQLMQPVAKTLEYAHNTKVVHHNVNPDAIAIDWSQEFLEVKVTGFALAQPPGARQHSDAMTAAMHRNVAYLSPEQAADTGQVDHRTDIYSFGACMYLLATGQPPFAGAYHQVLQQLLNGAPRHPSEVASGCPPVLSDVILKCMAKSPDARYASIQEALDELTKLRPFAAGREHIEIVGLHPPSRGVRRPSFQDLQAAGAPPAPRAPRAVPQPQRRARREPSAGASAAGKILGPLVAVLLLGLVGGGVWYFLIRDDGRCKEGTKRACYTGPPGTKGQGRCRDGQQTCKDGVFGECMDQITPASKEICNGIDDNCDGKVDNAPDFATLGTACKAREGACLTPGKLVCTDDGKGLRCKASRKPKGGKDATQLDLILLPEKQPVTVYWRGKPHETKGLFCLPKPKGRRVTVVLKSKGYHSCRVRLRQKSWRKGTLTLELKRRRRGALPRRSSYCLR